MKNIYLSLLLVATSALTACASFPSKPLTFNQIGQFESYPLNAQNFRINFSTNRNISFGTAEEVTLLKAAQTSFKNGYPYFKVIHDPSIGTPQPPRQAVVYPAPIYNPYPYGYYRGGHRHGYGPYYDPFFYNPPPQVVTVEPTEVSYTIECFKDKNAAPNDAFDAHIILQSLGPKYGLNAQGDIIQPQTTAPKTAQ